MSWMGTGWGTMDTAWDNVPRKGGGGPRRVWMPPEAKQRHLFLDDDPQTYWEHNYKWNKSWLNWEPCRVRNRIVLPGEAGWQSDGCPPCDRYPDRFPYFIGLHTTINMTPWFTKKTNMEINFQREIFAAKMGSADKPGVLKKVKKLYEKYGRLRGLVFDIERPGKKTESCGSEFELVEQIDPKDIDTYMRDHLTDYLKRRNEGVPKDKQSTLDGLLKFNPWEPFDFEKVYKPKPIAELKAMFSPSGGATMDRDGEGEEEGSVYGQGDNSGGSSDADDDIPY
jgi:hypothetical protein